MTIIDKDSYSVLNLRIEFKSGRYVEVRHKIGIRSVEVPLFIVVILFSFKIAFSDVFDYNEACESCL